MPTWDPRQYLQFERERTRPCIDLVNRIEIDDPQYLVDLGCGPANSTLVLSRRFPNATILGVDSSASMIERARADAPQFQYEVCDAATWESPKPVDVILSNACFQWLEHHETLFPRLMKQLRPGGVLAVQMPRNFQSPTHQILRELAQSDAFRAKLSAREPYWVKEPGFYYDVLAPISARLDIWETEYQHILPDHAAIVEWYKGTGLRPYLQALNEGEQAEFLRLYHERLQAAYPRQGDGKVVFPFLRIFVLAIG